jgi:hypothetical protein
MGANSLRHALAVVYHRERTTGAHWIGGWVGFRLVWRQRLEKKVFAPAGDRNPVVQSVVGHYTD